MLIKCGFMRGRLTMKILKEGNKTIYLDDEENILLYKAIEEKRYRIIKELKNDLRSLVLYIEINCGEIKEEFKNVVLKIPREKNERKWQQFLSIFRGSEAKREFYNCKLIEKNGFLGAKPLVAVEKKHGILVIDSYFVLSYIEGRHASFNDIDTVLQTLYHIHDEGYTHGDAQLANFMIKEKKVYVIDCKLEKNFFGIINKIEEFIYFEKSCYKSVPCRYKESCFYKIIQKIDDYKDRFNYFSKKIRGKV